MTRRIRYDVRSRESGMNITQKMVYARDCNLNNNGVIHPETICAAADNRPSLLLRRGYTSIENYQRQAPVMLRSIFTPCTFIISSRVFFCSYDV